MSDQIVAVADENGAPLELVSRWLDAIKRMDRAELALFAEQARRTWGEVESALIHRRMQLDLADDR